MLGLVFTEFIEMVEDRFSPAMADAVITQANLPHGGAYTSVGYYPHEEIVALVLALSARTGVAVPELIAAFGEHLLGRFVSAYPAMFAEHGDLFAFLSSIDGGIHREVRKLYPQAQLPRFTVVTWDAQSMSLAYESPRQMEALALGLIRGAAAHFGETVAITVEGTRLDERQAMLFTIRRHA